MASSSLMAAQSTLFLCNPITPLSHSRRPAVHSFRSAHTQFCKPKLLFLSPRLNLNPLKPKISASISASPKNPAIKPLNNPNPGRYHLSGSTRTVTLAIALTASKLFAHGLFSLALQLKEEPLLSTAGPAFFAAARGVPSGSLSTPFTVVAKWLELYNGVLMVRIMLGAFPNLPWEEQPFSAIRHLCDPYLNLFTNIIPPIFGRLDVRPLLAFLALEVMGSILNAILITGCGLRG